MLFTELVDEAMQEVHYRYPQFLMEHNLEASPALEYYFYNEVLKIVEATPPRDQLLKDLVVMELKINLKALVDMYDLTVITIIV